MPTSSSTARRYAEAMLSFAGDEDAVRRFRDSLDRLGAALAEGLGILAFVLGILLSAKTV